jgi:flagellar biosynthesis/type III secretory pathway M-ring protein FliF/YscJ|tara:strand:- start:392 stop:499 length:108 start_codon:yes stop_codon:yes gene_type:complete
MEKLKNMWKDLSKPGKLFVFAIAVILVIVLVNYFA